MTNRARIAIIGTGWWSTYTHIPAIQAHPDADLVAICDANGEKLQAAAERYAVERTYSDYQDMIDHERPDGVIIATPHATHYEIAKTCLQHDLHVMVEKPMTLYAPEAKELVELAQARGRELSIGYTYGYAPAIRRAREVVRSGALGPIQYVNCVMVSSVLGFLRGDSDPQLGRIFPVHGPGTVYSQPELSGGGHGHLQITHMAGLLFFVTDLRANRVLCLMNNQGLNVDLVDVMAVEFMGGALGTVSGSGNAHGGKLDLQIHCAHGSVDIDVVTGSVVICGPDGLHEELGSPAESDEVHGRYVTSHNLVDMILGKDANGAPGEVGWRTVELLDAAYRSARRDGAAVTIDSLYS